MRKPWLSREELEQMFECRDGALYDRRTGTPVQGSGRGRLVLVDKAFRSVGHILRHMGCTPAVPEPVRDTLKRPPTSLTIRPLGNGKYAASYWDPDAYPNAGMPHTLGYFDTIEEAADALYTVDPEAPIRVAEGWGATVGQ